MATKEVYPKRNEWRLISKSAIDFELVRTILEDVFWMYNPVFVTITPGGKEFRISTIGYIKRNELLHVLNEHGLNTVLELKGVFGTDNMLSDQEGYENAYKSVVHQDSQVIGDEEEWKLTREEETKIKEAIDGNI